MSLCVVAEQWLNIQCDGCRGSFRLLEEVLKGNKRIKLCVTCVDKKERKEAYSQMIERRRCLRR